MKKTLPWKNFQKNINQILESQTFTSLTEVRSLVEYRYVNAVSINNIIEEILKFNFKFSTLGINWESLVLGIIRAYNNQSMFTGTWDTVVIFPSEIEKIKQLDRLASRQLMFFFLIVYKWNRHPSGWVNFPREQGFEFWELNQLSNLLKEEAMRECTANGLSLRVVGNKEPMICFHIDWEQPEGAQGINIKGEEEIIPLFWKLIYNE